MAIMIEDVYSSTAAWLPTTLCCIVCMYAQVNLSTAGKAFQTVNSDLFDIQLDLSSIDTDFNNTHPRLQVKLCLAGVENAAAYHCIIMCWNCGCL